MKKAPPIIASILEFAEPLVENRIGELKGEAAAEFDKLHAKLDKIIELLEK
jgi:hypothetical protein